MRFADESVQTPQGLSRLQGVAVALETTLGDVCSVGAASVHVLSEAAHTLLSPGPAAREQLCDIERARLGPGSAGALAASASNAATATAAGPVAAAAAAGLEAAARSWALDWCRPALRFDFPQRDWVAELKKNNRLTEVLKAGGLKQRPSMGNGACLFNCIAMFATGDEDAAEDVRQLLINIFLSSEAEVLFEGLADHLEKDVDAPKAKRSWLLRHLPQEVQDAWEVFMTFK